MPLPPQKFREIVFQLLFSAAFDVEALDYTALMLMGELKVTKRAALDACGRARQVLSRLDEIDEKIRAASQEYQFERISSAEKCALRLGFFEILFDSSLPNKVAIAEAIRLTRKFGTPESADFVNAILDTVYRAQEGLVNTERGIKHELELATQPAS
jgi:N utilization substance protein B